jgi:polyphosphate kinase 2 (PPK2 family)
VVRVHPELLAYQRLPGDVDLKRVWQERYESMAAKEQHLARNGVIVLKFWLNVSKGEQRRRFLARIDEPEKNWKFSKSDVEERGHWADYMKAYEESLNSTSRPWAPWYAVPADDKPFMRVKVAEIIVNNLKQLDLGYPKVSKSTRKQLQEMRSLLD